VKKILLVDDLMPFLEREKTILNRADFSIFTATTSEEALKLHVKEMMDLIVVNLDMPGIGGDKLCDLTRSDSDLKKVSVIIVCSNNPADIRRVKACGASAYVTKPLRPIDFLEKVSALLDVSERKSYRVVLKVRVKGAAADQSFFCASRDISTSGLLIETDKVLVKGDGITISFFLPGSERVETDAEVMRTLQTGSGFQYGVRYINIDPLARAAIEQFIQRRSKPS
jgi:DNA-binding response OmpR family regulator